MLPTETTTGEAPYILRLGASATISDAAGHRSRILEALQNNATVAVDVGELEQVDTTFVQLLAAARKSALRSGKSISVCSSRGEIDLSFIARASASEIEFPPRIEFPSAVAEAIESSSAVDCSSNLDEIDRTAIENLSREIGEPAFRHSLGVFFVQMASRLEVLRGLAQERDLALIRRETHLLNGTAGTFGLSGFRTAVAAFERDASTLSAEAYEAAIDSLASALMRAQTIADNCP